MDTQVDRRFQRAWSFFQQNATDLLLGGLVASFGWMLVLPGPWFTLNLLAEITDCLRTGRAVRWQSSFDRPGLLVKSWALMATMTVSIGAAFVACMAPGAALSVAWMLAPARVADGEPVLQALGSSFRTVSRAWTAGVLNALVLFAMAGLSIIVPILTLLTLPLALSYLTLCYLDEVSAMVPVQPVESVQTAVG